MKKYNSVLTCEVCKKGYNKPLSHVNCWKKFCYECKTQFNNETEKNSHCIKTHPETFCTKCNQLTHNLDSHKLLCKFQ